MHAGKIYIIDYEYGSYSCRGYDIANHFNEHVRFECDYSLADVLYSSQRLTLILWHINELYVECNFDSLVSHTYWAIHAIVHCKQEVLSLIPNYLASGRI
ncbi:unnamed protein product [Sphagnum jensenii]|uniref:ethanolamine kinase n=1 Tax=Sphagnum jensenii TaxID=128206 RepID=A0ABP0X720_9BRYO